MKVLFMIRTRFHSSYIYPALQFKLFDASVKPILLYCYEVWSPLIKIGKHNNHYYDDFMPEKVHTKFCKFQIGTNKYSSNIASKSETGRHPLAITSILHTIKNWLHLHKQQNMNKFAFQSLQSTNNTESLYAENIKTLLKLIDFGHVWEKQMYIFFR